MYPKCVNYITLTTVLCLQQIGMHYTTAHHLHLQSISNKDVQIPNVTLVDVPQLSQNTNQSVSNSTNNTNHHFNSQRMINQSSAIQSMNGKLASPELQHVQSSIENKEQNHKQQKLSKELDSWKSLDISKVVEDVDLADTGDLSVVPPEITEPCPNNFIRFKDSCYHIAQPNRYDFGVGESYCNAYDAKLVEINSRSEQKFVEELIELTKNNLIQVAKEKGQSVGPEFDFAYWIGASNGAGQWRWRSNDEPLTFHMWVSKWMGWVNEIETNSCALIDTSESNQWMFWPCANNFYMTGRRHNVKTHIGFVCEKESKRAKGTKSKNKKKDRKRRHKKKGRRRNWHRRHSTRFL